MTFTPVLTQPLKHIPHSNTTPPRIFTKYHTLCQTQTPLTLLLRVRQSRALHRSSGVVPLRVPLLGGRDVWPQVMGSCGRRPSLDSQITFDTDGKS